MKQVAILFTFLLLSLIGCRQDSVSPEPDYQEVQLPKTITVDVGQLLGKPKKLVEIEVASLKEQDQKNLRKFLATAKRTPVQRSLGAARLAGCGSRSELSYSLGRFCYTLDLTQFGGTVMEVCMCVTVFNIENIHYYDCYDKANGGSWSDFEYYVIFENC